MARKIRVHLRYSPKDIQSILGDVIDDLKSQFNKDQPELHAIAGDRMVYRVLRNFKEMRRNTELTRQLKADIKAKAPAGLTSKDPLVETGELARSIGAETSAQTIRLGSSSEILQYHLELFISRKFGVIPTTEQGVRQRGFPSVDSGSKIAGQFGRTVVPPGTIRPKRNPFDLSTDELDDIIYVVYKQYFEEGNALKNMRKPAR
jgi:hypothetical protein